MDGPVRFRSKYDTVFGLPRKSHHLLAAARTALDFPSARRMLINCPRYEQVSTNMGRWYLHLHMTCFDALLLGGSPPGLCSDLRRGGMVILTIVAYTNEVPNK